MTSQSCGYLPYSKRIEIVDGYSQWVRQQLDDGYIGYYANFMFNQLPGGKRVHVEIMKKEVAAAHGKLTLRVVRKPNSKEWQPLRPRFIGCPDVPVRKNKRKAQRLDIANDGLHFNGILFVPPKRRELDGKCVKGADGRRSRLKTGLIKHFKDQESSYRSRLLGSIHLVRLKDEDVCDYAFKAFKTGKVQYDDMLVL